MTNQTLEELTIEIRQYKDALLSLNKSTIMVWFWRYMPVTARYVVMLDDKTFWLYVHGARVDCPYLSMRIRKKSLHWLRKQGFDPDGEVTVMTFKYGEIDWQPNDP